MATFNKFQDFVEQVLKGVHDLDGTHTIRVFLTNTLPVNTQVSFDGVTNHPPPAAADGYAAGGGTTTASLAEVGGVATVTLTDVVFTAGPGGIGPFRYIGVYNDTPTTPVADPLMSFYDKGEEVTLADTETFTVDFTDWATLT